MIFLTVLLTTSMIPKSLGFSENLGVQALEASTDVLVKETSVYLPENVADATEIYLDKILMTQRPEGFLHEVGVMAAAILHGNIGHYVLNNRIGRKWSAEFETVAPLAGEFETVAPGAASLTNNRYSIIVPTSDKTAYVVKNTIMPVIE